MLFDTHAHLGDARFDGDVEAIIQDMREAGVGLCVTVGDSLASSQKALTIAQAHADIYCACGIHPHEAANMQPGDIGKLLELMQQPKVKALGEIGLDYYYDFSDRPSQKACFKAQLDAAAEIGKPVILHVRDAHGDAFEILKQQKALPRCVLHCYSGSVEMMRDYVKLGCYISFTGVITFKNANKLLEVVRQVPRQRLMVETDSPYLAPIPYRGKRNQPAYVVHTAKAVADIRGEDFEEVCRYTTQNGKEFFEID